MRARPAILAATAAALTSVAHTCVSHDYDRGIISVGRIGSGTYGSCTVLRSRSTMSSFFASLPSLLFPMAKFSLIYARASTPW